MAEDVCDIHLKDSVLGKKFLEDLTGQDMKRIQKELKKKSPAEMAEMRDLMNATVRSLINDGIDFRIKEIADTIKVQEIISKYTHDKVTGEPLKTYSEVVTNRLRSLVGRNSVDTKARNLRNHYRNMLSHFESMYKANENTGVKSISDIKKGSPEEEELYILSRQYEHEIDPATLTPEKVQSFLNGNPPATEMQRLALSLVTYNAYTRKSMSTFGISTKYSKNFVVKRRYDWAAVKEFNPEQFADYMYKRIDVEKTFGKGTTEEAARFKLRDIHKEMLHSANEKLDVTSSKEYSGSAANSMATKIEWKGHKEAYEAHRDLSVGALKDQVEQSANSMADRAIGVSEFGYNAEKVLAEVSADLIKGYGTEPSAMDMWKLSQIKRAEKELSGRAHLATGGLTNLQNNVRFFTAFTKLGNAVTGTVLDAVDNGRQAFYMNGSFFGGVADYAASFTKATLGMSKEQRLESANNLNLIFTHLSNAEGMRLASGDIATKGGALTNFIQEHGSRALNYATLLPIQTAFSNIASGTAGARQFSKLIGSAKNGKLNKFQKDFLNEYGFTKQEVDALAGGFFEDAPNWSDTPIFTGTGIRNALNTKKPDEVAKILGVSESMAGDSVIKLATKVESVINDWASRGTPKPELATKTLMYKNVDDEGVRFAVGMATQFLDTPIAQAQYIIELAQKLNRMNGGGVSGMIGTIKDGALPSATYLATGLSLYMAADTVMAIATNRESILQKYNNSGAAERNSIMLNAIGRTGFVPFLFEMIETQSNGGYNKTALDTFGSPALSTVRDTLRLAQGLDGEGGITPSEFAYRQSPTNSIPARALNNWSGQFTGEKLWDDKKGTFFGM